MKKHLISTGIFIFVLGLFPLSANALEIIHFGTKSVFSGATSTGMFGALDLSGSGLRAASFGGGGDHTVGGTTFSGTNGTNGISWTGATAGTDSSTPNSGDGGLNGVLSRGIHALPTIDITATLGDTYDIQLLAFGSLSNNSGIRTFDITVDGVLFADNFQVNQTPSPDHIIYSFNVIADADGIDIDLTNGGFADGNPFVQGIVVSQAASVPEPGISLLVGAGLLGFFFVRKRISA